MPIIIPCGIYPHHQATPQSPFNIIVAAVTRGTNSDILFSDRSLIYKYTCTSNSTTVVSGTSSEAMAMLSTTLIASSQSITSGSNIIDIGGSGGSVANSSFNQCSAIDGDATNGIALGVGSLNAAGSLVKFQSTGTHTGTITLIPFTNYVTRGNMCSIRCEGDGTNKWLIGTTSGAIIEVDQNGSVLSSLVIPKEDLNFISPRAVQTFNNVAQGLTWGYSNANNYAGTRAVMSMHYYAGWLTATCSNGYIYLINWATKKVLQRYRYSSRRMGLPQANNIRGNVLSKEGGIAFLSSLVAGGGNGDNLRSDFNFVQEWDMFMTPMQQKNASGSCGVWCNDLSIHNNPECVNVGFDDTMNYAWSANGGTLNVFTYNCRRGTTLVSEGTPIGGTTPGETIIIDDSGGVGTSQVMFHTDLAPGGQSVPITTAATSVIKAANTGRGSELKGQVSRV